MLISISCNSLLGKNNKRINFLIVISVLTELFNKIKYVLNFVLEYMINI